MGSARNSAKLWPLVSAAAATGWLTKKGIESQIAGGSKFDPSTVFEDFGVPVPEKKGVEGERHLRVTLKRWNGQENNGIGKKNGTNPEE